MSAEVARIGSEDSAVPAASHCGFDYTGCYCEENAWLLCQQLCDNGQASEDDLHVIFVSNPEQQVPSMYRLMCSCTLPRVRMIALAFACKQGKAVDCSEVLGAGMDVFAASWAWPARRGVLGLSRTRGAAAQQRHACLGPRQVSRQALQHLSSSRHMLLPQTVSGHEERMKPTSDTCHLLTLQHAAAAVLH